MFLKFCGQSQSLKNILCSANMGPVIYTVCVHETVWHLQCGPAHKHTIFSTLMYLHEKKVIASGKDEKAGGHCV